MLSPVATSTSPSIASGAYSARQLLGSSGLSSHDATIASRPTTGSAYGP